MRFVGGILLVSKSSSSRVVFISYIKQRVCVISKMKTFSFKSTPAAWKRYQFIHREPYITIILVRKYFRTYIPAVREKRSNYLSSCSSGPDRITMTTSTSNNSRWTRMNNYYTSRQRYIPFNISYNRQSVAVPRSIIINIHTHTKQNNNIIVKR